MAAPEDNTQTSEDTSVERKVQEDLWLYRGGGFSRNARWFAFSTAAHILVLSIFATTAVTIMKEPEMVRVSALPLTQEELDAMAEEELPDDWEGELLTMEDLAPNKARPTGPASTGPLQAPIQRAAIPVFSGIGPVTIEVQRADSSFSRYRRPAQRFGWRLEILAGAAGLWRLWSGAGGKLVLMSLW